jgi:hypothetical protein
MHTCQGLGRRRRDFADEAAWIYPATKRSSSADRGAGRDRRPARRTPHVTHAQHGPNGTPGPALARLIGQLGDPSAQISGALADRAVVGMPADAAAVAHREGVLPGGKKRPQFLPKLVHVVHGVSLFLVARVAPSATRPLVLNAGAAYSGISARTRSFVHAVDRRAGAQRPRRSCATRQHRHRRASVEPRRHQGRPRGTPRPLTTARRPDRPCLLHGLLPASQEGPGEPRQAWLRRNVLCVESRSVPSSSKAEARRGRVLRGWADCARFVGNGREPGASGDTRYRSSGGAPRRRSAVGAAPCRIACLHGNARQTCARTILSCSSSDRDPPCR